MTTPINTEEPEHLRAAFTLARFEQLDTMLKYRRFNQVPYNERTFICGVPEIEDRTHALFDCQLY